MLVRRLAQRCALVLAAASVVTAVVAPITNFPRGLFVLLLLALALVAGWHGVLRRGVARGWVSARSRVVALAAGGGAAGQRPSDRDRDLRRHRGRGAGRCARTAFMGHAHLPRVDAAQAPGPDLQPVSGGGKATRFQLADEAAARDRADRADARHHARGARRGGAGARSRRAGDGRRRRLAGDRRGRRGAGRRPLRLHSGGHPQPLRARPRRRPRRRRRRAGRVHRRRRAPSSTWPRSTAACSSTTSRSASTPRRCSSRATATRSSGPCSTRSRRSLRPTPRRSPLRWRDPDGVTHDRRPGAAGLQQPVSARARRSASGTRPRLDTARAGGRDPRARRAAIRRGLLRMWRLPSIEVDGDGAVPAGIDGEAAMLEPPLRFSCRRRRCASGSPTSIPAPPPRPSGALETGRAARSLCERSREPGSARSDRLSSRGERRAGDLMRGFTGSAPCTVRRRSSTAGRAAGRRFRIVAVGPWSSCADALYALLPAASHSSAKTLIAAARRARRVHGSARLAGAQHHRRRAPRGAGRRDAGARGAAADHRVRVHVPVALTRTRANFSEPLDHVGAVYFTVTVISTVGFGDIVARTDSRASSSRSRSCSTSGCSSASLARSCSRRASACAAASGQPQTETDDGAVTGPPSPRRSPAAG